MGKRIILNLQETKLEGDILDVGESFGVIYNLSKDVIGELAIDFVEDNSIEDDYGSYDVCTMFFHLSKMFSMISKQRLIEDVTKYLKPGGEIFIWDINKDSKEMIKNEIITVLPAGNIKEFEFKNLNPLTKSSIEINEKLLEKSFEIEETKVWEYVHYIKAIKVQEKKDEYKSIN